MTKPFTIFLILCLLIFQNIANTPNTLSNETIHTKSNNIIYINLADSTNTPNTLETANTPSITPTPHKSLSGLNRDLSRSTAITKDIQTNALDSSLSIDNRIFSTSGRDDIASDIKNFRDNTIKAGIGATLTAINPLLSTYQILHSKSNPNNDEQISFSDSLNQWKLNQTTMVNTLNLSNANNRNILNNLANKDNPQSLQSIHNALNPSDNINLNFYYDERDEALGFFDKNSKDKYTKEIYLNTAKGVANDTHTLINTYNHEITHSYTSNETIANNAGKLGNFLYNTINTLNGDKIYASKNNSNPNISNNLTHKSISKVVNNITPISQATSQNALEDNNFGDLDLANPQYLTPKSWLASQSKESISILQSNTYNASFIDSVDRDNALPLVPIITFGMTAYRGYNFIQRLDKARDIIARANPQSDESSNNKDIKTPEYRDKKPHIGGKEGSKDTPSWAKAKKPFANETNEQFANRVMKEQYGKNFNLKNATQNQRHEYSTLKKYSQRSFEPIKK